MSNVNGAEDPLRPRTRCSASAHAIATVEIDAQTLLVRAAMRFALCKSHSDPRTAFATERPASALPGDPLVP
jgi:hypothetical protein